MAHFKTQFANFNRAYDNLDKATADMQKGKDKVVENELDQKMAISELQFQFEKFKKETEENLEGKEGKVEVKVAVDAVRIDICNFIESIKTLFEKLAAKVKSIDQVLTP